MGHRRNAHTVRRSGDLSRGRLKLGSWVCPSGNSVDVYLHHDAAGRYHAWFYWDQPPPLLPADRAYYLAVIRPAVIRQLQERTGQDGTVLVLTVEEEGGRR